ncbi:MAG: InlB B-repeat-containing protein, partial [Lachnospiraceae bacterium]|nr:InlB B-repeat-containing protein [Lachnospiraceae bacterium]
YTVTYHNNTTPPDTYITKADVSLIKEAIVEKAEVYSYTGYASGDVSYSARNTLYLDDGGKLWMRESTAKTLPNLLFGGTAFRSLELIEGTSSSYSSSGGSSDSVTSVYAIAFAENGAVYGIAPDGTCTSLVPAGSTGHLWGNMTLFSNESNASPYGSGGGYGYFTTYYLYYLYNGAVYRKSVYESSSSSYSSSSGSSSGYGFYTVFGTAAQKISPNGADVTSFFVYSTSLNKKEESVYNGQQSSSAHRGYTYSLPKAFLMTSDGRCMTGGYDVDEYYNTSSYGNQEGTSAGYDDAVFINGPEKISYAWTTMADSNRFRQIVASSNGEVGSTQYTYSTPGGMQVHPSSYDNINVIDGNGNLIYIRDINQSASGYLGCGTAVTVCTGKNFVSAEITDGDILLTDASGNTWKYVESTGAVTAYDNFSSETTPVELLVVGYEFATTLYDCMFDAAGREFLGWTLQADGTGTLYRPGDELAVTAPTTVYAKWDGAAKKKIVYLPNGGVGKMEDDVYPADTPNPVTLQKNAFTRRGYEFAGWSYKKEPDSSDVIYTDEASIVVAPGVTKLYAQWKSITYTVKVGTDDMRVTNQSFTTHEMQLDTELTLGNVADKTLTVYFHPNPHPSMSTTPLSTTTSASATLDFYGWRLYEDSDGDGTITGKDKYLGYYNANTTVKNLTTKKNVTLYFFPYWSGTASYVKIPEFTCTGYSLIGFTPRVAYAPNRFAGQAALDEAILTQVLIMAPVGSNAKYQPKTNGEYLYAYYEPNSFVVDLSAVDATTHTQTTTEVVFDSIPAKIETLPTRTHYLFKGYYTTEDGPVSGVQYFDENGNYSRPGHTTWVDDGTVTILYAYWIPEKAINYIANNGSDKEETFFYSESVTYATIKTVAELGYSPVTSKKFLCWNTMADGSGTDYYPGDRFNFVTTGIQTLYAKWVDIEYIIQYARDTYTKKGSYSTSSLFYNTKRITYSTREEVLGALGAKQHKVAFDGNKPNFDSEPSVPATITVSHSFNQWQLWKYN